MANKMIIDASHPEETRVVVLRGNRVEEFDFESASKKQLRGNIYLAKVTRVEPSLQAAFVEYGGNRHGFLAFSEIHPDYYQIPHADRVALLEEESRAHREEEDEDSSRRRSRRHRRGSERRRPNEDERVTGDILADEDRAASVEAGENTQEAPADAQLTETTEGAAPVETVEFAGETALEGAVAPEAPAVETGAAEETSDVAESPAEEPPVAEAPAAEPAPEVEPAPRADSHELACDPEGFAVVEETGDVQVDSREEEYVAGEGETVAEASFEGRGAAFDHDSGDQPERIEAAADRVSEDEEARARRFLDREQEGENGEHTENGEEEEIVEQLGGDAMDETPYRMPRLRRQYKIQEVIKRRQVLLIQVVKEERGNKGAALTTYLSLAGR